LSLILVTGGLGFIGSHTCINLINNGHDVLIADSLENSNEKVYEKIIELTLLNKSSCEKIKFFRGDLRHKDFLDSLFNRQILQKRPIESVIHFAGLKSVEESVSNPLEYWETNINSTLNLLSVMDKYKCYKLVFSSSATIYKPKEKEKLFEFSYKQPLNPYGNTKLTIELILKDIYLSDIKKWNIINLRYFNPIGAHTSGSIGENPKGKATNLFPVILKVISGELEKLSIFGNDWPTKDGTCIRDYIHVMDLAEAHNAALKYLDSKNSQILALNIGTGIGHSVLEVIETFSNVNSINIPFSFVKRRRGDAPFVVADNSLALKTLKWEPVKSLEDACRDSFKFLKKNNFI
jgi:UDP-glucose 4-epimerase|tara:strand:- start:809 stop:1855 length:1047 start_codon:yes stop_codon:yes gene_type:complete